MMAEIEEPKKLTPKEIGILKSLKKGRKYPNGFGFGFGSGILIRLFQTYFTFEPFYARPFSYLTYGLILGAACWRYDYWRRCKIELIMQVEDENDVPLRNNAINRSRFGEEKLILGIQEKLINEDLNI